MEVVLYLLGALVATCGVMGGVYVGSETGQSVLAVMVITSSIISGAVLAAFGYVVVLLEQIRDAVKAPAPQPASVPAADQVSA